MMQLGQQRAEFSNLSNNNAILQITGTSRIFDDWKTTD
jgi:hypothetical protein